MQTQHQKNYGDALHLLEEDTRAFTMNLSIGGRRSAQVARRNRENCRT